MSAIIGSHLGAVRLVTAGPDPVRELRAAFAPVYAWLEEDRQTRDLLARVRALRDRTPAEPPPACPRRPTASMP